MSEEDGNPQPPPPPVGTSAIAIRPPPFLPNRAKIWFTILEAHCANANVSSSTAKFRHCLANLPLDVCDRLSEEDLSSNDYDLLKSKIINLYSKSAPQILNDFLQVPSSLNTKPSIFLQNLRINTANWNLPEDFIKTYFINAMPMHIRTNLIARTGTLDELAGIADNLIDYSQTNPSFNPLSNYNVAAITPNHVTNNPNFYNRHSRVDNSRTHTQSNYMYSHSNIPLNVRSFHAQQRPKICRFHIYYGHQARRCKPWCLMHSPSLETLPNSRPPSRSSSPARDNKYAGK